MFNPKKNFWDNSPIVTSNFMRTVPPDQQPIRQLISKHASMSETILECGCATMIDLPLYKNKQYVGLDISRKLLKHSKQHNPHNNAVRASITHLPFTDETFDSVYAKEVLVHLPPDMYKQAIKEMWRTCKKQTVIAFNKMPADKTEYHVRTDEGWPVHYNQYSLKDVMNVINSLPNLKNIEVTDGVQLEGHREPYLTRALFTLTKNQH